MTIENSINKEVVEIKNDLATLIHAKEDFKAGEFQDTSLNSQENIILNKGIEKGYFISPIINCNKFSRLIASWNAYAPAETEVELQIKIRKNSEWSGWFSYGKWSVSDERGSISNQQDEYAKMDVDVLVIAGDEGADGFVYRIVLTRKNDKSDSPEVKLIAASLKLSNTTNRATVSKAKKYWVKELDVPARAQLCIPDIGKNICSPTSLSMVMEYYGHKHVTEHVASQVKDNGADIYGNWVYNTAYAGSTDLYCYVDRYESVEELKEMISMNMPIIVSIMTKSSDELEGSIMPHPSGHLMVVRGFKIKEGNEYVIVNDPAEYKKEKVRREYRLEEFDRVWRKIVYVMSPDLEKIKAMNMHKGER